MMKNGKEIVNAARDELPAILERGEALLRAEDTDGALAEYDGALALDPKSKVALVGKAEVLLRLDRPEEASRYLNYAARHHPDDPAVWYFLGTTAVAAGQGELAVTAFTNHQRLTGASAESFLNLAVASYFNLDLDRAKNFVELALLEDPQHDAAQSWQQRLEDITDEHSLLVDVGCTRCREGRFEQGLVFFQQALELKDSFPAHLYAGRALLSLDRYAEGISHLQAALEMEPDDIEAMTDLATACLLEGQETQAEQLYDRILELDADNIDALLAKGQMLLGVDSLEASRNCVEHALEIDSSRPKAWLLKGQLFQKGGDPEVARLCADHAIALELDSLVAWMVGAEMLQACGEGYLASLYTAKARRLHAGHEEIHSVPPSEDLTEVSQEVAELAAFVSQHPDYLHAFRDRAVIYDAVDMLDRALHYLDVIRERWREQEDEQLVCLRGVVLLNLGRLEEAKQDFEQALEINPESAVAQQAMALAEERLAQAPESD